MAELLTKNGYIVSVNDEDLDLLDSFDWYATCTKGGWGIFTRSLTNSALIPMGRFLLQPPEDLIVDHIDVNHFNMRRENLQIITQEQNMQKAAYKTGIASKYRGVGWSKRDKKWTARIRCGNNKRISLGYFEHELDAAKAYDRAAIKYYGSTAATNFQN